MGCDYNDNNYRRCLQIITYEKKDAEGILKYLLHN